MDAKLAADSVSITQWSSFAFAATAAVVSTLFDLIRWLSIYYANRSLPNVAKIGNQFRVFPVIFAHVNYAYCQYCCKKLISFSSVVAVCLKSPPPEYWQYYPINQ